MRSGRCCLSALLSTLALAAALALAATPAEAAQLSQRDVRDRIAGGWVGALIGGAWGIPTEFRYRGRTIPADQVPDWSLRRANRYSFGGESDETYVEIPFLDATLAAGPSAGFPEWGAAFARTEFPLFFANLRARDLLRA